MKPLAVDASLVRRLVAAQFPRWKELLVRPVALSGWDNRTFHLGEELVVRMPSGGEYATQVEKEQTWLPRLAPLLPRKIPEPVAMGEPGEGYPWKWSIYRWLDGESAASVQISDMGEFASTLAHFLCALQRIDTTDGPLPGHHSFFRGGPLATYTKETRRAIAALKGKIDDNAAHEVWERGLETTWQGEPVWVHGDVSAGNLLVKDGQLCAVIDFGQLAVGDPACDLAIAWTFFEGESREVFRKRLPLGIDTWARGRAWALWKALILAAGLASSNAPEYAHPWHTIQEVLET